MAASISEHQILIEQLLYHKPETR